MTNGHVVLPVKVFIQIRDGVLNEVGGFDIEVFSTRALTDEQKIDPDAKMEHLVRTMDLAGALRQAASDLEDDYLRRVMGR
jgi:hypothetical protein